MEFLQNLVISMGIPAAITGVIVWFFKRYLDKRDAERAEQEKNTETLMLMIMNNCRATHILAEATARAVQRIPDAHCNGDMTNALTQAEKVYKAEKDFVMDQGIKRIFEN